MRRVRYNVAMSLDGYIAGADGEYDWIVPDPSIDFAALFSEFDTVLMGRNTFISSLEHYPTGEMPGMQVFVFSATVNASNYPKVNVVNGSAIDTVAGLKRGPGKDIWLFGGGKLFRTLLDAALVDSVEVAVIPVLLGSGIPLVPRGPRSAGLQLSACRPLPSGIVLLTYAVPLPATAG